MFDGALEYEVLVLPPEPGTFLTRLGVRVVAGAALLGAALETGMGAGFVKGLTGHEPAYWTEVAGEQIAGWIEDAVEAPASAVQKHLECQTGALVLSEVTKSFLQKDVLELNKMSIRPRQFREEFEARNKFYWTCAADQDVRGVGFTESDDFPVKRKDFSRLQVALPPKETEPEEVPWQVDTVRVTSPNWERGDKQRHWKGRDSSGHERLFRVEDEDFWYRVAHQSLTPHIFDTMRVQWAFHSEGGRVKDTRVLRVLQYNDTVLAEPLNHDALDAILGRHSDLGDRSGGLDNDLFGRLSG